MADRTPEYAVVGTGPAAAAATWALLQRFSGGERPLVTVIDAGYDLDAEGMRQAELLASVDPANWPREERTMQALQRMLARPDPGRDGFPLKLAFGSDYPYHGAVSANRLRSPIGFGLLPSLAYGGFSSVWGASVLPYSRGDLDGWPIGADDLESHYRSVQQILPILAEHDGLEPFFPLYGEPQKLLPHSTQIREFLSDLSRHRDELEKRSIYFGKSRLAIHAEHPASKNGCFLCDLCLRGCPRGLIFNSKQLFEDWEKRGLIERISSVFVRTVEERDTKVVLRGKRYGSGENWEITRDRVFLAAGVLGTSRVLLESLRAYDRPVPLHDSQYFLFPLLRYRATPGAVSEPKHTLSQLFLEIFDSSISRNSIHLQLYSYSDLLGEAVKKTMGPLRFLSRPLLERLLVVQGYLHSDLSGRAELRLSKEGDLLVEVKKNPDTLPSIRKLLSKIRNARSELRAVPLGPMLKVGEIGRGFHAGGTFPMRNSPGELESDLWGRPTGFSRVHAVDATVFPTIPASTITYSVMANSHRIASDFPEAAL